MALSLPAVKGWGELSPILGTSRQEWVPVFRLAGLEEAVQGDLCVLPARATPLQIRTCRASVVVGSDSQQHAYGEPKAGGIFVVVDEPSRVFLDLLEGPCRPLDNQEDWLEPGELVERFGPFARTAMVHRSASIARSVRIGAGAVVHSRVRLGDEVSIGEGSVIGAWGFGLIPVGEQMCRLPHWGGVEIGPRSSIGPQCQISAGLLSPTRIGADCHLDAQIQVGHNCQIGDRCVLAGQVGISGSVVLGQGCQVGGQAGFADHVKLGEGCVVAARAGVTRSWPERVVLRGFPARPGIPR